MSGLLKIDDNVYLRDWIDNPNNGSGRTFIKGDFIIYGVYIYQGLDKFINYISFYDCLKFLQNFSEIKEIEKLNLDAAKIQIDNLIEKSFKLKSFI